VLSNKLLLLKDKLLRLIMLHFHDAPIAPALAGMGVGKPSYAKARQTIRSKWNTWFAAAPALGAPGQLPVGMVQLAARMAADTRFAMNYATSRKYCDLYLSSQPQLAARPWMGDLPTPYRRTADEILGTALSLASAVAQGYQFFASREQVNEALPKKLAIWTRPWAGKNGPDYVLDNGLGSFSFLEVKGKASTCRHPPTNFAEFKTQSLNANLMGLQSRYLLSYAYLPANGKGTPTVPAVVQWFNATQGQQTSPADSDNKPLRTLITLAVAYCQFKSQLRNAGYPDFLSAPRHYPFFIGQDNAYWLEKGPYRAYKLVVAETARQCFSSIEVLLSRLRDADHIDAKDNAHLARLMAQLTALRHGVRESLDAKFDEEQTIYRYPTGIHIVQLR
jgi:hypothetical protein